MTVERFEDAERFLDEAGPLLLRDEPRHNLILGIAGTIHSSPDVYPERSFWLVRDGGEVVAAALRTPPYNLALARPLDDAGLGALVDAIDDDLPGVVAAVPEVDVFSSLWCSARRCTARVTLGQGVYALREVARVPRAPGEVREATAADLDLVVSWFEAFAREALPDGEGAGAGARRRLVEHRLGSADGGFTLWQDGGRVVSLSGYGSPTPSGIRIGPVYTPPELRGRGYATALVAEQSARLLAGGREFCFLYTDLSNPTANAIYERIGYVRVCESRQLAFE